jgi:putative FmdB family regulatory protein
LQLQQEAADGTCPEDTTIHAGARPRPNRLHQKWSSLGAPDCILEEAQFFALEGPVMPLYEYECNECGRRTEKIQKFSDPELTVCPHCGGRIERTLTAPAAHFKGGGWYKDLYSSAKPVSKGSSEAKSGSDASKPSDSSASAAGSSEGSSSSSPAASPAPATSSKN